MDAYWAPFYIEEASNNVSTEVWDQKYMTLKSVIFKHKSVIDTNKLFLLFLIYAFLLLFALLCLFYIHVIVLKIKNKQKFK